MTSSVGTSQKVVRSASHRQLGSRARPFRPRTSTGGEFAGSDAVIGPGAKTPKASCAARNDRGTPDDR